MKQRLKSEPLTFEDVDMLDTKENNSPDQGLIAARDNNLNPLRSFAIRGIGAYGQDALCSTVLAPDPARALMHILVSPQHAAAVSRATAWVVTRLP